MKNRIDIENGRYWDRALSLVDGCTPCSPGCDHCWPALERQVSELTNKNCELQEKLDEYENAYKFIMDDKCFNEEKHCACTPILRAKMKELEAENGRLFGKLQKIMVENADYREGERRR